MVNTRKNIFVYNRVNNFQVVYVSSTRIFVKNSYIGIFSCIVRVQYTGPRNIKGSLSSFGVISIFFGTLRIIISIIFILRFPSRMSNKIIASRKYSYETKPVFSKRLILQLTFSNISE